MRGDDRALVVGLAVAYGAELFVRDEVLGKRRKCDGEEKKVHMSQKPLKELPKGLLRRVQKDRHMRNFLDEIHNGGDYTLLVSRLQA